MKCENYEECGNETTNLFGKEWIVCSKCLKKHHPTLFD